MAVDRLARQRRWPKRRFARMLAGMPNSDRDRVAPLNLLVLYGSYRRDRKGIRLAEFAVRRLQAAGHVVTLIDAKAIGLPMLDRMYKEHPAGQAPPAMAALAAQIRAADGFVFVTGEYNWGAQPGLKNLTDHFLEEWFWRPAGVISYSAGRLGGARANLVWHGTLSEMGMAVVPSTVEVGSIDSIFDADAEPTGPAAASLERSFAQFAADLAWWAHAARLGRAAQDPPY